MKTKVEGVRGMFGITNVISGQDSETKTLIKPPWKLDMTIVGKGVMGLTTANKLAQAGHSVRVIYNADREHITSWAAAAFWLPVLSGQDPRIPRMAAESLEVFNELAKNPATGVRPIRLHVAYTSVPKEEEGGLNWLESVPTRPLKTHELPVNCSFGFEANVFRMEMEKYLPFLEEQARWNGVEFERRSVKNLADVSGEFVVNASGVFAQHLANDPLVRPIRGQVVLVETPSVLEPVLNFL